MSEKIRLIIWDLDETFWHGTLTEGRIAIRSELCQLVKDLAARGIMSSICSKNKFEDVKVVLQREGVWDYFIFPNINWEPKGPRVAGIIESVQLRAPTILFIDDNPSNLQEAKHFVPDIQVQSQEFISSIVAGAGLFAGKDDRELTRLRHYKLLEARKRDEQAAGADNSEFLRACDIRVEFERDVEKHIDRVVELINRTNQLNFTKIRLPEDPAEARKRALELLGGYNIQAALLNVRDSYGGHGFAGLYIMNSEHKRLLHFAFSCRILGMGVEQWLYNLLGRPRLEVKGEVLSDPTDLLRAVDWINQSVDPEARKGLETLTVDRIVAHGGCDLSAVAHYFGVHGVDIVSEFNVMRGGFSMRVDHSVFLRYACSQRLSDQQLDVAKRMNYEPRDFRSEIFSTDGERSAVLLSFATDAHYGLYRHRKTGLVIPCLLDLSPDVGADQRPLELPPERRNGRNLEIHDLLKAEFDYYGITHEGDFKDNIRSIFRNISTSTNIFIIIPSDYHMNRLSGEKLRENKFINLNRWTAEVASRFTNVRLIRINDFVNDISEIKDILHYDRNVYYRIYKYIADLLERPSRGGRPRNSELVLAQ